MSNVELGGTPAYKGFFGFIGTGGKVRHLGVEGVTLSSTGYFVGGIAGCNYGGTITACWSTAGVSGTDEYGGVAGANTGTVTACFWSGTVTKNGSEVELGVGMDAGGGSSDTKLVGSGGVTWLTAQDEMNAALPSDCEWSYTDASTSTPPTLVQAES